VNKRLLNGIGLVLVALVVSSCGPKAGLDIEKTVSDAQQMATDGRVDQALAQLESFYKSKHYKAYQQIFLTALLQMEVNAERLDAARKRYMVVAMNSPEVAAQAAGIIENAMLSKGKFQDLMQWCVSLSSCKLGDAVLAETAHKHVAALFSLGRAGELDQVIGIYLPLLSEPAALGLVNGYFSAAVAERQWDRADSLLKVMDKAIKDSPSKHTAKVSFSVNLLLGKEGLKAADSYFRGEMAGLTDSGAASILRVVGEAEVAANDLPAADSLYEFGLVDDTTRSLLRDAAAVGWLNIEEKRGRSVELIRRLTVLQSKNISVNLIVNLISQNYAGLIGKGTPETFDALNQFCESLRQGSKNEMSLRQLDGILLDISYFREDYAGSLKIIERGLILDDPATKDMMVNKINAHLAIKHEDYRGAIGYFRKFMEVIAKDANYTVDPIDQVRVSPAMILGLNARRIGDLWVKAGSAEDAAKAYAEARQHYAEALKEFPDSASAENKKIVHEMNAVPKG
jgi:tetratricopeptide (TPR) repeat protein